MGLVQPRRSAVHTIIPNYKTLLATPPHTHTHAQFDSRLHDWQEEGFSHFKILRVDGIPRECEYKTVETAAWWVASYTFIVAFSKLPMCTLIMVTSISLSVATII